MKKIELNKIAEKLQQLEMIELRDSGLKNLNGGFAIIDMHDYDDEILYVEIQTGIQTGRESDYRRIENAKIDRKTLEWIEPLTSDFDKKTNKMTKEEIIVKLHFIEYESEERVLIDEEGMRMEFENRLKELIKTYE